MVSMVIFPYMFKQQRISKANVNSVPYNSAFVGTNVDRTKANAITLGSKKATAPAVSPSANGRIEKTQDAWGEIAIARRALKLSTK
jgi:hypothetical protein